MSTTPESEEHFDEFEHYNFDQEKAMNSGHSGELNFVRYKKEWLYLSRKAKNEEGGRAEH